MRFDWDNAKEALLDIETWVGSVKLQLAEGEQPNVADLLGNTIGHQENLAAIVRQLIEALERADLLE